MTMQVKYAGAQAILRRDHGRHALSIHCTNHRLNLGAKSITNHNRLLEDTVGACQLLMKIFKYLLKRNTHFEKLKVKLKKIIAAILKGIIDITLFAESYFISLLQDRRRGKILLYH